jgi:cell division protein FtsN
VISASEKAKESSFKRTRRNSEVFVNEAPKLFYTVIIDNYRQKKEEAENKTEQEFEIGLPPQPKEYLKYPDYDWF